MTAIQANELKSRNAENRGRPLSACLLAAALAVAVAGYVIVMAPLAWTAARNALATEPATLSQCERILDAADRLACFDGLGKQALQPPAKGALAPAIFR